MLEQFGKLTSQDRAKYAPHIGNVTYLISYLRDEATHRDTGLLLMMEIEGERRKAIIDRILGRLTTFYRKELKEEVDNYLNRV